MMRTVTRCSIISILVANQQQNGRSEPQTSENFTVEGNLFLPSSTHSTGKLIGSKENNLIPFKIPIKSSLNGLMGPTATRSNLMNQFLIKKLLLFKASSLFMNQPWLLMSC